MGGRHQSVQVGGINRNPWPGSLGILTLRLYKALGVPCAVIADLDCLAKDRELKKVLTELESDSVRVSALCDRARKTMAQIRSCISQFDPAEIETEFGMIAQELSNWEGNDPGKLRGKLIRIVERLNDLHALKLKGIEAVPEQHKLGGVSVSLRAELIGLLEEMRVCGFFLVPEGELESWLPVQMNGVNRQDKSRWAMLAAEKIEDIGERDEDVWAFVRAVYEFLAERLGICVASEQT
jgi:hypothetical protein